MLLTLTALRAGRNRRAGLACELHSPAMVEQAPSLSRGRRYRRRRSSRADRLRRRVAGSPVLRSWQLPTRWALAAVAVAALAVGVYAGFQHHDAAQVQQADELGL